MSAISSHQLRLKSMQSAEIRSLQSPVSWEYMTNPFIGPCGHTYDEHDIVTLVGRGQFTSASQYVCPLCRKTISVSSLYKNLAVMGSVLEINDGKLFDIVKERVRDELEQEHALLANKFLDYKRDNFFSSLVCPWTGSYINDPMIDFHGHTFDHGFIEKGMTMVDGNKCFECPYTSELIKVNAFVPNKIAKSIKEELQENCGLENRICMIVNDQVKQKVTEAIGKAKDEIEVLKEENEWLREEKKKATDYEEGLRNEIIKASLKNKQTVYNAAVMCAATALISASVGAFLGYKLK